MILVIRHGRTELNSRQVLQGRSDWPLDGEGVAQAEAAARRLRALGYVFDRVCASPLRRAVETARIVAPGLPVATDDRLIEMDYGPYEGMDLAAPPPEVLAFFRDFAHVPAPAGMEPLDAVVARTRAFMETLRGRGGNVLVSTHAIAMKGILEALTPGANGAFWPKYVANCAVYAVPNDGGALGVPFELA